MNDGATQSNGIFIAVYIFQWVRTRWSPQELTSPELGSTLGRVMVVWKGLSSTPSRSGAGAELGEATALQAVANNLFALLLSGSLHYPEGRSWWTDVLSRGLQLQLDLSSLLGCSHHQHVSACGSQVSWLFLSPSSLMKQRGLVGLQTLSACPTLSGKQQCAWPSLRWDSEETTSSAIMPFLLHFTLLSCKMREIFPNSPRQVLLDQLMQCTTMRSTGCWFLWAPWLLSCKYLFEQRNPHFQSTSYTLKLQQNFQGGVVYVKYHNCWFLSGLQVLHLFTAHCH